MKFLHFKVPYRVSHDEAELISDPILDSVEYSSEFGNAEVSEDFVIREGVIFECGDYPDKNFSLSEDEAQSYVDSFEPVPFALNHKSAGEALAGAILESIKLVGNKLIGRAKLPTEIDALIPNKTVSCSWSPTTKRLRELSFTASPRIAGAALFSKETDMTIKDVMDTITGKAPEVASPEVETKVDSEVASIEAPAVFAADTSELDKLRKELDAKNSQLENERTQRIAGQAANFATKYIVAGKASPNEEKAIVKAYVIAASNDEVHGAVNFSGVSLNAVSALTEMFDARVINPLLETSKALSVDETLTLLGTAKGSNFNRDGAKSLVELNSEVDANYVERMKSAITPTRGM